MNSVWGVKEIAGTQRGPQRWRPGVRWLMGFLTVALTAPPGMEAQEVRTITLGEAVEIALEQSNEVQSAMNAVAQRDVAARERKMEFLPSLSLSSSRTENYGRYFSESEGQVLSQSTGAMTLGVSASVILFDGLANVSQLRSAGWDRDAAVRELERSRQTAVFRVFSDFLQLVERREQLRVQRENLSQQEGQENQIHAYVDGGTRPISDLYQQRATVAAARVAVLEAENAVTLGEVAVIRTLQLDPMGHYEFQVPSDAALSAADSPAPELSDLIEAAFLHRPDLSAAEMKANALEGSAQAASAGYWPTVSLSARYNTNFQSTSPFEFWDQLDQRRGGSVSLNVSIPVFDKFTTRHSVERAELQVENASIGIQEMRHQIAAEVRGAHQNYLTSLEQITASATRVTASEMALESTRERYEAGMATLVELSQAQAALLEANSGLVRARYNVAILEKVLRYYLGSLGTETGALL